ncbi:DUF4397 domain-containing protein [Mucilaginibacter terrae]|uniref:DUF4397 domain-containing protein n=1 Tax=Mucilaginibacter terrae TaxID=1955052 RepID=UPI00362874FB
MLKRLNLFNVLLLLNMAVLVLPLLTSCGTSDTVTPTNSNVQLQVLNLSPDSYPIELYMSTDKINNAYRYSLTPAYFYLNKTDIPLQVRSTRSGDSTMIFYTYTGGFLPNTRYSLFFTGLYSNNSLKTIVTVDDTTSLPPVGKGGKIRFVNASLRSENVDIWVNGTVAIKNTAFATVSNYITLSPGNYTFRVYPAGTSASSIAELPNVTVQDGRLYTLYSRGIVGKATTDTAAFGLGVLANNPPVTR